MNFVALFQDFNPESNDNFHVLAISATTWELALRAAQHAATEASWYLLQLTKTRTQ